MADTEKETVQEETPKENFALYSSEHAPSFKMRLESGHVQFRNGVLRLDLNDEDDKKQHEELQKLLKKKPHIRQHVKYVNISEAEALARKHQALMKEQMGAHSGPVTSDAVHQAMNKADLARRDEELRREGMTEEQIAEFNRAAAEDGLQLTGKDAGVVRNADLKTKAEDTAKDVGETANKLNKTLGGK